MAEALIKPVHVLSFSGAARLKLTAELKLKLKLKMKTKTKTFKLGLGCFLGFNSVPQLLQPAHRRSALAEASRCEVRPSLPLLQASPESCVAVVSSTDITWHEGAVSRNAREKVLNQKGCVLWFTGLSGSGKSTLAYTLEHALHDMGKHVYVLDGDNIRHGLNKDLGFTTKDRAENMRRIGEVSVLFADAGAIVLVSVISPYKADRDAVRARLPPDDFIEVYMNIPIEVCEKRDPKGLYKLARAGKIKGFTGIDDPYEEPEAPELIMETHDCSGALNTPADMAATLVHYLKRQGVFTTEERKNDDMM